MLQIIYCEPKCRHKERSMLSLSKHVPNDCHPLFSSYEWSLYFMYNLKVPVLKSLENGQVSYQNIIRGEKIVNMYPIYKQFEKTMFMLLIVL